MKAWVLAASMALIVAGACAAQDMLPEATEVWEPVPARVEPGAQAGAPPSDAVVLSDLSAWVDGEGRPARWSAEDGVITVVPRTGDIRTRESFGDVQLHIEWRSPVLPPAREGQNRANSGVFLQGRYEVQVLDTLTNRTYSNGQAASIYKQHIPLVNAARPAGEWQVYDIVYTAPRFGADGAVQSPARITVLFNGVLVQNNVELAGPTTYIGLPQYEAHGEAPLQLQDHGEPVSFRNIWVRRL
jgi:hypothetical protein